MKKGGGRSRRGKPKSTARKAKPSKRGSKVPKISVKKTAPLSVKQAVIKHGQAVEYIGGEKTLRKGRHKIFETGPLTIGKPGISVVKAIVDGLEKLSPSTKLSYNLEVRFNDAEGERKSVVSSNEALPRLQAIRFSASDKKKYGTRKTKWLALVYARLREQIFKPIIAEFGFVSGKRVTTHERRNRKLVRIRSDNERATIAKKIDRLRDSQNTRFRLTIQREVF